VGGTGRSSRIGRYSGIQRSRFDPERRVAGQSESPENLASPLEHEVEPN